MEAEDFMFKLSVVVAIIIFILGIVGLISDIKATITAPTQTSREIECVEYYNYCPNCGVRIILEEQHETD